MKEETGFGCVAVQIRQQWTMLYSLRGGHDLEMYVHATNFLSLFCCSEILTVCFGSARFLEMEKGLFRSVG